MIVSAIGVLVVGVLSSLAAWWVVGALALSGVAAGVVAVLVAMPVALLLFALFMRLRSRSGPR